MRGMVAVWEEDREGGPLPVLALDSHLAAVQEHQLVDDGQAQSGLAILGVHPGTISLVVAFPDIGQLIFGHPDSVVGHLELAPISDLSSLDLDQAILSELNGILRNVEHNLDKPVIISVNPQL